MVVKRLGGIFNTELYLMYNFKVVGWGVELDELFLYEDQHHTYLPGPQGESGWRSFCYAHEFC